MFKRLGVSLFTAALVALISSLIQAQQSGETLRFAEYNNGVLMVNVTCAFAGEDSPFVVTIPDSWIHSCLSDHANVTDAVAARQEILDQAFPGADRSLASGAAFWALRPDPVGQVPLVYVLDITPIPAASQDSTPFDILTQWIRIRDGRGANANGYDFAWHKNYQQTPQLIWSTVRIDHDLGLIYKARVTGDTSDIVTLMDVYAAALLSPRTESEPLNIDAVKALACECFTYGENTLSSFVRFEGSVAREERSQEEILANLVCQITALEDIELFEAPDFSAAVAGTLEMDERVTGLGVSADWEWILLENNLWMASYSYIELTEDCYSLPVIDADNPVVESDAPEDASASVDVPDANPESPSVAQEPPQVDNAWVDVSIHANQAVWFRLWDGHVHAFRFQGVAGQEVTFIVRTFSNRIHPYVELWDHGGAVIASRDELDYQQANLIPGRAPISGSDLGPLVLPETGIYTIVLSSLISSMGDEYAASLRVLENTAVTAQNTFRWRDYAPSTTGFCLPAGVETPSAAQDAQALEILQQRPFNFSRPEWLSTGAVAFPPVVSVGESPDKSVQQDEQELRAFLSLRFPDQPVRVEEGMALLNHPILIQKIPDHRLRAALLTNLGTVGEVAIDLILNDEAFRDVLANVAFSQYTLDDGMNAFLLTLNTNQIFMRDSVRNEPIQALGSLLFHELVHVKTGAGESAGKIEEAIISALDRSIAVQNILLDPESYQHSTPYTRDQNSRTVGLLNASSEHGGAVDLIRVDGRSIAPGNHSIPARSIVDNYPMYYFFEFPTRDAAGTIALRESLEWLARCSGRPAPVNADFTQETYNWINALYRDGVLFSDAHILQAATHLGMTPPELIQDPLPVTYPSILLQSAPEGKNHLYLLDTEGSTRNLAPTLDHILQPQWSPDGTRIAFTAYDGGNYEVFLMNADGSGLRNISNDPVPDSTPSWSPDGSRILFDSRRQGRTEIYAFNVNTGDLRRLIAAETNTLVSSALWSPDGRSIVFNRNRGGSTPFPNLSVTVERGLYVSHANGRDARELLKSETSFSSVMWSPDGTQLLFSTSLVEASDPDIYVVNIHDGEVRNLTQGEGASYEARWSPDGSQIAFVSDRSGNPDIFVMSADGSDVRPISASSAVERFPQWSPDGRFVAFHANRAGTVELYMAEVSSGEIWRLTDQLADNILPLWQPSPDAVTDPMYCTVSSRQTINQRSGPGTNFAQVGSLAAGASTLVLEQTTGADGFVWWYLADDAWVRSDLVTTYGNCEAIPQAESSS